MSEGRDVAPKALEPRRLVDGSSEGLKFLRTATFVGVVWLIVAWVGLGEQIVRATGGGHLVPLSRALHVFGHGGATLLAALVTFLVGTVSLQVFRAPSIWLANGATLAIVVAEASVVRIAKMTGGRDLLRRYEGWRPVAVDLARRILEDHARELARDERLLPLGERQRLYTAIDRAVLRELEDPALAGSYIRRLNERALLRLGLIVPTLALVAVLGWKLSPWFLSLLPVPFVLGFQAFDYRVERDACLEDLVWRQYLSAQADDV